MSGRVLVVDDDPGICWAIQKYLEPHGWHVRTVTAGTEAIREVERGFVGPIILDVRLPDIMGHEVFAEVKRIAPDLPVIFLTGFGTPDLALSSISEGAFDFLDKGALRERLLELVETAHEQLQENLRDSDDTKSSEKISENGEIIAVSREMQEVFRSLKNVVDSNVTVLIQGESGTGKEVIARAIHARGARRTKKFVALNCAGIPETLLEAELFGYERGAFTGATSRKPGIFEVANKGTLLLDEIGEMHPSLQAKLLRVVQSGEYQRLGGVETLHTDVRLLSATHRNLEHEIQSGGFREDLFYRLAVFTVMLPPLRERTGDVRELVNHFLSRAAEKEGKTVRTVDRRAMEILESYSYPGNVRELENLISFAVVSTRGPTVTLSDLPKKFLSAVALERDNARNVDDRLFVSPSGDSTPSFTVNDRENPIPIGRTRPSTPIALSSTELRSLKEVEEEHIRRVLATCDGNKAKSARILGINRVTLYRKLKDFGLA